MRLGCAVGLRLGLNPVPATNHDPVWADLTPHRSAIAFDKVLELGPGVDRGELQSHVAAGVEQLVTNAILAQHVARFALIVVGVGASDHSAVDAHHDLFTLDLGYALQEYRAQGDTVIQRLGQGNIRHSVCTGWTGADGGGAIPSGALDSVEYV